MAKFRFQDLKIWQLAMDLANELCDIADLLEHKKLFRFAEQVRAAGMSMPNNIAEGSGAMFNKEFYRYLSYARSSTFENANMMLLLERRGIISSESSDRLLDKLDHLCRQITNFQQTL